jgi:hypothetical protein
LRWKHVFPRITEFFGIDCAEPQTFSLAEVMQDKAPVWERMVGRRGLQPHALADLANWPFGDFIFNVDAFFDVNKARRFGFNAMHLDSADAMTGLFQTLRTQRIIP